MNNGNLNKLVTNYPVELTEDEIANLSSTLAPVIAACGGGGGGTGGKIYTGIGFVTVNNTTNQIGLTNEANTKLNQDIPTKVSDLSDSANYQTVAGMDEYLTTANAASTYQTKDAMSAYWTSAETKAAYAEDMALLIEQINGKQDILTFAYDNDKISAINGSALAGQGGGTGDYTAGTDLKIENNIISVNTNGNPNNTASNTRNFVEGSWTEASGYNSHAEGMATTAYGYAVHAQGMWTKFSSSKWSDEEHKTPIDIYWADGAGATVEGYCNATTSCPMSGNEGASDYGPIHGGVLKVIGNGNVVHDTSVDPDAHIHTLHPSDALIIFKDGTISAFGDIFNNGKKYVTEDSISSYNITAQQGVEVTPTYDSTNKTITFGISITSTPVITDTKLSGYNGIAAAKDGNVSGQWNVGLTNDMLNTINGKLDTTDFNTYTDTTAPSTYQPIGNYLSSNALEGYATTALLDTISSKIENDIPTTVAQLTDSGNYYQKTETSSKTEITNALNTKLDSTAAAQTYQTKGDYVKNTDIGLDSNNKVTAISGKELIITAHQSLTNYYTKNETSGKDQLSTEFAKYVTSSNVTTPSTDYVMTTTGWKVLTLPGGGMTQVIHDDTLTGQGNADASKLGVVWSALSGNTIYSAKSATVATNYYDDIEKTPINISTVINNLLNNSLTTTSINPDNGISGVYNSQEQQFELGLAQTAYNAITSVSSKLDTTAFSTVSSTFLTKSSADNDYAPKSVTADVNTLTAASAGWNNKVDKPNTSFVNNYLALRTDNAGNVSGWVDLKENFYSKSEATGTFVATANIDTTTLSGDGKTVSTKLGVKTDVIATKDYVSGNYLPTSGGTVSGELVVSAATGTFDNSYVKCVNNGNAGYARFGVGSYGGAVIKAVNGNNNVQVNVKYNANNNELIQVQKNGTDIGFLIPAVTSTTTAGITNDGILHIILES